MLAFTLFMAADAQATVWPITDDLTLRYVVRPGDTLTSVAKRFDVTVEQLRQSNLDEPLRVKSELTIPVERKIVRRRDSLWTIAQDHGLTTIAIRRFNRLSGSGLRRGQVLLLPARNYIAYRARAGDTETGIAKMFHTTVEHLREHNQPLAQKGLIAGELLFIFRRLCHDVNRG